MKTKNELRNLLLYTLLVLIAYSIPINTGLTLNERFVCGIRSDYVIHFLLFLPVPFLVRRTLSEKPLSVILLLICGAALVESIHLVIPNRSFNLKDALANCTGITTGTIAALAIRRRKAL